MSFLNWLNKPKAEEKPAPAPEIKPEAPETTEEKINAGWWASELAEQLGKTVEEMETMLGLPEDTKEALGVDELLTLTDIKRKLAGKVNAEELENAVNRILEKEAIQTETEKAA